MKVVSSYTLYTVSTAPVPVLKEPVPGIEPVVLRLGLGLGLGLELGLGLGLGLGLLSTCYSDAIELTHLPWGRASIRL